MVWIATVVHKEAFEGATTFTYIIFIYIINERTTMGKERIDKRRIPINVGPTTGVGILLDKKLSQTDALGIIRTSRAE